MELRTIMQYPILIRTKSTDRYVAEPVGLSELRVEAATETDALEQVGQALKDWLGSNARLVHLNLEAPRDSNPWLESFGRSADDPLFEDFLEEMARARADDEHG